VPFTLTALNRSLHLTGCLSQLNQRLAAGQAVSREEMAQALEQLRELESQSDVPGAETMHEKYSALLQPYLQSAGLAIGAKPGGWDQAAAQQRVFSLFQQSIDKSKAVSYVHGIYKLLERLTDGQQFDRHEVASIFEEKPAMTALINQYASEMPQLAGQFDQVLGRLSLLVVNQLMSKGTELALEGKFHEAITNYELAAEYCRKANDTDGLGMALQAKGQASQWLEDTDSADACYAEARECYQQSGSGSRECQLLFAWGSLWLELSNTKRARELFSSAAELAEAEGNGVQQAEGLRHVGESWALEGDLDAASESYEAALAAAESAGNAEEQRRTLGKWADLYRTLNSWEEAAECLERALAMVDDATYPEERVAILFHLSNTYEGAGQIKRARKAFDQAYAIAEEAHDEQMLATLRTAKSGS
jgi:tetratricopeptide (TPR) repeat protein